MNISILTKHKALFITILSFLLFSFACNSSSSINATAVPSIIVTYVPSLTYTSTPTNIPVPTPTNTNLPTSTATPIPLLISNAGRIVRSEHFDNLSTLSFSFDTAGDMELRDGLMILTDPMSITGDPWGDGHVAERSRFSPQVGNLSIFLFKADDNTYFGYHYELYESTDSGVLYRGINLDCCVPGLSLNIDKGYGGNHANQSSTPVTQFKHGVWYFYALQVQLDGFVKAQLWERDQPNTLIFDHNFQLDEGWTKPGFTFIVAVDQGEMDVDEYQEVELTDAK